MPRLRFPGFNDAWEQRKLGELADIVRGASPRPIQDVKWFDNDSDVGWLRISDVTEQDGRIKYLAQRISKLGQEKTRVLVEPHLLLSIAATVGKPVVNYVKTGVHDGFLIFLNPKFEQEFMFQWLDAFRENWKKYGQPGSQVNLNSDLVRNQDIYIPSPQEQTAIGNFFRQLDAAIASHQRKLERVKELKKSLLQKMFPKDGEAFPELRFPNFTDAWEQRKLGEVAERVTRKNTEMISKLPLTISAQYGLIAQTEFFDKQIASKNISGYYLIKNGEFAYNKSYSNGYPWGAVKRLNNYDYGVLSTLYIVFKPTNINSQFLVSYYDTNYWHNQVASIAVEGARNHGLLNISASEFFTTTLAIPKSIQEQTAIGDFFRQLDAAIASHQRKLEHMQTLKKGLLQQMFV